jgi:hypothetical protein
VFTAATTTAGPPNLPGGGWTPQGAPFTPIPGQSGSATVIPIVEGFRLTYSGSWTGSVAVLD